MAILTRQYLFRRRNRLRILQSSFVAILRPFQYLNKMGDPQRVFKYALAYILIFFTLAWPVAAQETRTEIIAQMQTVKAKNLHPYVPTKAERIFLSVKKVLIDEPSGLYPLFGSVYGGGGFAVGGGYRQYYGDSTYWDAKGLWSIRNYKLAEISTNSLGHAQDRIDLHADFGWRDATQVAYYGLGMATSAEDRANFRFKKTYGGASLKARPIRWVKFGGAISYEDYNLNKGLGARPSIEQLYTAQTAPALGTSPAYIHSMGSAGFDWRPAAGYARRGGMYEIRYHNFNDRKDTNSFDRLDAEVVQHVPILRENWVISLRGLASTTLDGSNTVPFFLLPSLGSSDTLRVYSAWRFRDRHSVLLQGEFRWIPNRMGLDMAMFFDAGKVTPSRSTLNLKRLKKDTGIEVRFHGPAATPLRLGVGHGTEGWHLVFGGSAAF